VPVIDVHTHMLSQDYLQLLSQQGGEKYQIKATKSGQKSIFMWDAPFMTLTNAMWDYDLRIKDMDDAGVDIAIVSLTCPNAFFGNPEVSLKAARMVNDSMAEQQTLRPDRIRWFASIPWQHEELALKELKRARESGAVGVMQIANIDGQNLTDDSFANVWKAIDQQALPVLVHPTAPQGVRDMSMNEYGLVPPVGFMFDTTLAISRMILDGFFDRYPNLKIIASHGGATLPYLAGRLDRCYEMIPACSETIKEKPSTYLKRIYYDTVVYSQSALSLCLEVAASDDNLLFGSDYPHVIGDMQGCLARVNALSEKTATRIRGINARRIFNL